MGILLIVSLIVGLFSRRLCCRTDELSNALEQLHREEHWRSALIDMLAHDIRSPVGSATSALLTAEARLEALSSEDLRRLLTVAIRQSRRAIALADDVLAMARARQERLELRRQPVAIADELRHLAPQFDDTPGWVTVDAPESLHASVDPGRLGQIVTNLLSNARKHGRPPVEVSARALDLDGVELRVSDAGSGVAEEYHDTLFTPFASGPRTDSVGLGLWLVHMLARAHGVGASYATVDGRPTFIVELPGSSKGAETKDSAGG